MASSWDTLVTKLHELHDFSSALKLLHWDQQVMMPPEGAPGRARAIATIQGAAHRLLTAPEIGELIEQLRTDESLDEIQGASVRVLARDHAKATKLPNELVRAIAETQGLAYAAWTRARPAADFSMLAQHLERLLDLKKQEADALGWTEERYDALLDEYEPGAKTSQLAPMFEELVAGLKPISDGALGREDSGSDWLFASYDEDKQQAFCGWLVEQIGFRTDGGRLDKSPHPFTIGIGSGDVRQTMRTEASGVFGSIYAAMHETGHALYEQGIPTEMRGLPVGRVPSLGMHESQSRLWENQVGRGHAFVDFLLPHLKERFPDELGMVTREDFYRGVNRVRRSFIRVSADELTYNLHVALRFKLELALFRDQLAVADLPAAWNDAMDEQLGIRPENDAEGVLQDMHWSIGAFGYFPTYTLGTLYAAAIYKRAHEELGDLDEELRRGDTSRLLAWLRDKVHGQGYLLQAGELVEKVVGEAVGPGPLLGYLDEKYSDL
ncbi:carboxypeptidase M32 [soil metagenome]